MYSDLELPEDCLWSEWMPWDPCSRSCQGGTRAAVRFPEVLALNGGKECDMLEVVKQGECNTHACPCFLRETWPEPEMGLLMLGEDEFENDCSYCKPYDKDRATPEDCQERCQVGVLNQWPPTITFNISFLGCGGLQVVLLRTRQPLRGGQPALQVFLLRRRCGLECN